VTAAPKSGGAAAPTPRELIEFEALWPDRSVMREHEGRRMTHSDMIRVKWGLTEARYRQVLFAALGFHLDACLAADAPTTYRLLGTAKQQRAARSALKLGGSR
jgi:hypothetical protein